MTPETAFCQPKGLTGPAMPGQKQAYTVRLDQVPDISITVGGKAVPIATPHYQCRTGGSPHQP